MEQLQNQEIIPLPQPAEQEIIQLPISPPRPRPRPRQQTHPSHPYSRPPPRIPNWLMDLIAWCWYNRFAVFRGAVALIFTAIMVLVYVIGTHKHKGEFRWCAQKYYVAKIGNFNFSTISAALEATPNYYPSKICIFIDKGIYYEKINIGWQKTNLVLIGAGAGQTIISSNQTSGTAHYNKQRATLLVKGMGFIARDLTIENTAEPDNIQGFALENRGHYSIFYQCKFVSRHVTINAIRRRIQFYSNCEILGHHYFIYGNAHAIFQNCKITAVKRHPEEKVVISGHPQQNNKVDTGFVFHLCKFFTFESGTNTSSNTYLGGQLKGYATTVVMKSYLDASISGWIATNSTSPTIYFAEFKNYGPGAFVRINSPPCVRFINDSHTASKFTVRGFLNGGTWLQTFVPYKLDL